ncbi:MAG: metallophosphoesterase [Gemmatimonadetes bacterium]|nr:metallophosphoesterase [Gemmatimonadota bacterium]
MSEVSPDVTEDEAPLRLDRRAGDRRRPRQGEVVRLAAVGDFHAGEEVGGTLRAMFGRVNDDADVLLLAGDLTRWGTPAEMRVAVAELAEVEIPIVAVLGNHDHESGQGSEVTAILRDRGVHVLDGDIFELNERVGIAGAKGFMGGFGRRCLTAFGESATKEFVSASMDEVHKLELALRRLSTPVRVALLHYAPVVDTVVGEPEQIYPFLGTDRLADPLDRFEVAVAFHGHAHHGAFRGETAGGVPVFNVSMDLLRREGIGELYYVHEILTTGVSEGVPAGSAPDHE